MNDVKEQAIAVMNELHRTIPYTDYCTVMDGIQEMEPLRDRDEELEELWAKFGDVPMNPETECIEEPFMGWGAGIHREEIWHWFDKRYSKGVYGLLYGVRSYLPASVETGNVVPDVKMSDCSGKFLWWLRTPTYKTEADLGEELSALISRNAMCFDCDSADCSYNHEGTCRFALVHERKPEITDDDGCIEGCIDPTATR